MKIYPISDTNEEAVELKIDSSAGDKRFAYVHTIKDSPYGDTKIEEITPEETIRIIEVFLTAFRKNERRGIATQIYNAMFTIGYRLFEPKPNVSILNREEAKRLYLALQQEIVLDKVTRL